MLYFERTETIPAAQPHSGRRNVEDCNVKHWRMIFPMAAVALAGLVAGCKQEAPPSGATAGTAPLKITCTIGMIGDVAQELGGEQVAVTSLMGSGVDPHLYKASQGDLARGIYYSILFMMAMPFAIVGTFGGLAYRTIKREQRRQAELKANESGKSTAD